MVQFWMKWCCSSDIESNDVLRCSPEISRIITPIYGTCFRFQPLDFCPPFLGQWLMCAGPRLTLLPLSSSRGTGLISEEILGCSNGFIFSHESNRNWTSTELGICHNIFGSAEQIPRIGKLEDRVTMEAKTFAGTLALWRGVLRCKWLKRPLGRL